MKYGKGSYRKSGMSQKGVNEKVPHVGGGKMGKPYSTSRKSSGPKRKKHTEGY